MSNGQSLVQSFTPGQDGRLANIELNVRNDDPSVQMRLEVIDGGTDPNFVIGASQQDLVNASVATASSNGAAVFSWTEFDFDDSELILSADHHYFMWLRMLPPYPNDAADRFRWNLWTAPEVADPYPDGRAFFCPFNSSDCSAELGYWDYAFRMSMVPSPTLCDAERQ